MCGDGADDEGEAERTDCFGAVFDCGVFDCVFRTRVYSGDFECLEEVGWMKNLAHHTREMRVLSGDFPLK